MLDFIKGVLFVALFLVLLNTFGKKINKSENFSENLIVGYVLYTCLQFIGGFITQQFALPWYIYCIYMVLILIAIICFSFIRVKINVLKSDIISHFKNYYLLYIIAIIFVALSILNLKYQWQNNHVDDGYYLMKMRLAPYMDDFTNFNFAAGVASPSSIIRNINTFEIEGAFYAQFLGINATIYSKIFLSFINYTIVLNIIYWLYETFAYKKGKEIKLVIALIPILFFGIFFETLVNTGILNLQDGWQFNTAMWYGSTFVRTAGFMLLLIPLLVKGSIGKKEIVFFLLISITLLSKASQAIPVIILSSIIYVWTYLLHKIKNKRITGCGLIIFVIILLILPVKDFAYNNLQVVYSLASINFNVLIIKISIFFVVISSMFELPKLRKWNIYLLIVGGLIFVPRFNTLFAYTSIYTFVAGRVVTLYMFTLIITAFFDVYIMIDKLLNKRISVILTYAMTGLILISIPLYSVHKNLGINKAISIISNNNLLIPESTLKLGNRLIELANEKKADVHVLMPMWRTDLTFSHPVATMLRFNDLNRQIVSIGTMVRYSGMYADNVYYGYNQDKQDIIEDFQYNKDSDGNALGNVLNEYPINTLVVFSRDAAKKIEDNFDFTYIDKIDCLENVSYYIYYKNELK